MDHERGLVIDDVLGGIQARLSLEGTVLEQRAAELKTESYKLARQRAFLREERRKARADALAIQQDQAEFENMQRKDWFPEEYLKGHRSEYRKVKINVGGQLFELSEVLLNREPKSLLAALLEEDSPLSDAGVDGAVHVDRDWWIFRHILKFLRDGVLPRDRELLTAMYKESSFWRFNNLKCAIEEQRLNLKRKEMKWEDGDLVVEDAVQEDDKWYKKLPNWWESHDGKSKKKKNKKKGRFYDPSELDDSGKREDDDDDDERDKDWWSGSKYNGKDFGKIYDSDDEDKPKKLSSTWSTGGSGRRGGRNGGYAGCNSCGSSQPSSKYRSYGDYEYTSY